MRRAMVIGLMAALLWPLAGQSQETIFKFPFPPGTVLTAGRPIVISGKLKDKAVGAKAFYCVGPADKCRIEEAKKNPLRLEGYKVVPLEVDEEARTWTAELTLASSPEPFNFLVVNFMPIADDKKNEVRKNVWLVVKEYSEWTFKNENAGADEDEAALTRIYRSHFPTETDKYAIDGRPLLETIKGWKGGPGTNYVDEVISAYYELGQGKFINETDGQLTLDLEKCKAEAMKRITEPDAIRECNDNFKILHGKLTQLDAVVTAEVETYSTSLDTTMIEQIKKWLGFNAGLAYLGDFNEVQPYVGLSIYFFNTDGFNPHDYTPSSLHYRLSLAVGYSYVTEQFPLEDEGVSNLYFVGVGLRLNPYASLAGGEVIYDHKSELGEHDQRHGGYVALTLETFALQTILENMAESFNR